ncbi:hypothetical protein M0R19_05505 [Candidatus Pacearchaeota archaeon]|jgi:hypothetical protein|nr:hypothetical protein [Candidatus Pacearchaeota archaeon]
MKKWEYYIITPQLFPDSWECMIQRAGLDGWELVCCTQNNVFVFKRELVKYKRK